MVCILRVPGMQLKGNQVQILNSPAAVSFTSDCCKQPPLATGKRFLGRRLSTETSQKTCLCIFFIAFEEKALSLMSRNYSIRHFIHHSDSEKVSYDNKLCQVYLVCPAEVSSSGHFNNKKQRWIYSDYLSYYTPVLLSVAARLLPFRFPPSSRKQIPPVLIQSPK